MRHRIIDALRRRTIDTQCRSAIGTVSRTTISTLRRSIIAALPVMAIAQASAAELPARIAVVNAWSRATAPGTSVGAAYFSIVNSGAADVLVEIETPRARRVEMHSVTVVGGVMQMRPTATLAIPAGGRVVFEPGTLHAMLIDLVTPLAAGEHVPLTLTFREAGKIRVDAAVLSLDEAPPAARVSRE